MRQTVELCLSALLDNAGTSSTDVRREVIQAIVNLSKKGSPSVLEFCVKWISEHSINSITVFQRTGVLCAMANIVSDAAMGDLSISEGITLIKCGVKEMTAISDLTSEWSQEALRLVIGLCILFPSESCYEIISTLKDGTLPHFYVLLCISNFAEKSPDRILPYTKELITKLLPPLGSAKQDNHRMLLSRACGSLAEVLIKMSYNNLNNFIEYNDLMYSTLNFFLGDYSRCNEHRVRVFVTYAIGCTFALCSDDKKIELAGKVAQIVIQGVRREKPHETSFPLRGLAAFFSCVTDNLRFSLQPFVEGGFHAILQVLGRIGLNDVKIREDINTTIMVISDTFLGELLSCISLVLEIKKDHHHCYAALCILWTIVKENKNPKRLLQPFVNDIVAIVKLAIGSQEEIIIRKTAVECILSICTSEAEFFKAIGYNDILSYLITSASISEEAGESFIGIRDTSRNGLVLLSSSSSRNIFIYQLWPFIFEHMREYPVNPSLIESFCTICNCIVQLANRVSQESSKFYVDFSKKVNVPRPGMIASIFLSQAMLIEFYRSEDLFTILEAALAVAPLIDDPYSQVVVEEEIINTMPITDLWTNSIPKMQQFLTTDPIREDWEVEIERLVDKTFKVKQSEEWSLQFTSECLKLIQGYKRNSHMLRSALIIVGIGCSRTVKRDLVAEVVDTVVNNSNHDDKEHLIGLAKCLGYVARKHLDKSLEVLSYLAKGPEKRGFFTSRDKTKKELVDNSRLVASVGFGYACKNMDINALPSRLDTIVFPVLNLLVRDGHVKGNLISLFDGCRLVGSSITRVESYLFRSRDEFLLSLIHLLQSTSKSMSLGFIRSKAFDAFKSLIGCTPIPLLSDNVTNILIDNVINSVNGIITLNTEEDTSIISLLSEILKHHHYSNALIVLEKLAPLTVIEKESSRLIVVKLIFTVLNDLKAEVISNSFLSLDQMNTPIIIGSTIGRLVPRLMDNSSFVRVEVAKGILAGIELVNILTKKNKNNEDNCIELFLTLGKRVSVFIDDNTLGAEKEAISINKSLCTILVEQLNQREYINSILRTLLFISLFDSQKYAAIGACITMHGLIRGHGNIIDINNIQELINGLIEALKKESISDQVRSGILTSIRNLTRHHVIPSFNVLLRSSVPHNSAVISSFEAIANDSSLCELLIQHILDTVLNNPMTNTTSTNNNNNNSNKKLGIEKIASPLVISAVCAAGWVAKTERGSSVCKLHRAPLYMSISLFLTVCHSIKDNNAIILIVNALKNVTNGTSNDDITILRFDRYGWGNLTQPNNYLSGIRESVCYWCRDGLGDGNEVDRGKTADFEGRYIMNPSTPSSLVYELADFMLLYCGHVSETHRKVAVCVCGELISFVLGNEELMRALIMALLSRTGSDEEPIIREIVLVSMVNILKHSYVAIQNFVPPILSSTLGCIERQHATLSSKAINLIGILAEEIEDKSLISGSFVTIAMKLRSIFDHEVSNVREKAFNCLQKLYSLANCGKLEKAAVGQHVYPYIIPMLIHLAEEDKNVCISAKTALRESLTFISYIQDKVSSKIKQILSKPHMIILHETNAKEIYDDIASIWISNFPGMVKEYVLQTITFTQSSVELSRRNSALILGVFINHIPPDEFTRCGIDQASNALIKLVSKDEKSQIVRVAAANAIGSFSGI